MLHFHLAACGAVLAAEKYMIADSGVDHVGELTLGEGIDGCLEGIWKLAGGDVAEMAVVGLRRAVLAEPHRYVVESGVAVGDHLAQAVGEGLGLDIVGVPACLADHDMAGLHFLVHAGHGLVDE